MPDRTLPTTSGSLTRALLSGQTVELEGCRFVRREGPIEAGDWYIAQRNAGPWLLTAKSFSRYLGDGRSEDVPTSEGSSWINPMESAYPYDTHECVRVREVDNDE